MSAMPFMPAGGAAPLPIPGIEPPFFRLAKISAGGVKLKSSQHQHDFLQARSVALVADDQRRG